MIRRLFPGVAIAIALLPIGACDRAEPAAPAPTAAPASSPATQPVATSAPASAPAAPDSAPVIAEGPAVTATSLRDGGGWRVLIDVEPADLRGDAVTDIHLTAPDLPATRPAMSTGAWTISVAVAEPAATLTVAGTVRGGERWTRTVTVP